MARGAVLRPLATLLLTAAALASARADAPAPCGRAGDGVETTLTADDAGWRAADGTGIVLAGIAFPDAPAPGDRAGIAGQAARMLAVAPPDRYGRIPVLVFGADGRLVQAELVRAGHAAVRPEGVDDACAAALLAIEAQAREARHGLWGDGRKVAEATDDASLSARTGLYTVVQGRVVSLGYGSRMVFLDFGRNFRKDFTVLVPESLQSRLLEAGFPLDSLEGRTVRVRGVIEESGGPAIRLAHPSALELVDGTK